MRTLQHRHPIVRPAAGFALATLLLVAAALPALAKEGMAARLDAPIGLGTPGGTTILVGMVVTVADASGAHPVEGSPIYLKLTGPGGSTRALAAPGSLPGHYAARIVVPAGGATGAEVGIHGTSDLAIELVGTTFVAGGVTSSTAQLAPALAPALTPFARASAAPAAANPAPVAANPAPAPVVVDPQPSPVLPLLAVGLLVLGLAGVTLAAAVRRARAVTRPIEPRRAPGA